MAPKVKAQPAPSVCCSSLLKLLLTMYDPHVAPDTPSSLIWEGFEGLGQSQADKLTGWAVISWK